MVISQEISGYLEGNLELYIILHCDRPQAQVSTYTPPPLLSNLLLILYSLPSGELVLITTIYKTMFSRCRSPSLCV